MWKVGIACVPPGRPGSLLSVMVLKSTMLASQPGRSPQLLWGQGSGSIGRPQGARVRGWGEGRGLHPAGRDLERNECGLEGTMALMQSQKELEEISAKGQSSWP